jgi:hemolysin activation/secretion protein
VAGDLLNLRDIEQALENLKRVPTAEADIQIVPSEGAEAAPGDSDLLVTWKQGFPLRLNMSIDNSGTTATGKLQGSLTVSADNPLALNDLFYVTLNHDLSGNQSRYGTQGGTVHYSVPYGDWLFGATANNYAYHQSVIGANQTYVYGGTSNNADLRVSRLVWRDANSKTILNVRGWARESDNTIDDIAIDVQQRRMAGWEIGASERLFLGAATLDANVAYRRGTGAFNALPAPEEAFGEGTSRLRLFTADAQVLVPFEIAGQRLRYTGVWRAQWNETPLVPQDRFAIGGRYTVRGFDGESILSADRGWLIRNDLGATLGPSGAEAYCGVDFGQVGGQSSERLIGTYLAGAVLGLRGSYQKLSYDFFVGKPLAKPSGFNTASTTTGFSLMLSL